MVDAFATRTLLHSSITLIKYPLPVSRKQQYQLPCRHNCISSQRNNLCRSVCFHVLVTEKERKPRASKQISTRCSGDSCFCLDRRWWLFSKLGLILHMVAVFYTLYIVSRPVITVRISQDTNQYLSGCSHTAYHKVLLHC
jgi:hypothetical protein